MSGSWTPGPGPTTGDDSYLGTSGADIQGGLEGNDTLLGEGGDDLLSGNAGDDSLLGGTGVDALFGGDGNDVLNGGGNDDLISGGDGADTIFYNQGDGTDTIFGGQGADEVLVYAPGGYTTTTDGLFTVLNFTATGSQLYVNSASITNSPVPLPCFAEGTAILTARGEVAVEALRVGDLVVAMRDGRTALTPIAWLGHSRVNVAAHPRRAAVAPIRIRAGALRHGVPTRDLRVSPDHGLHIDGQLIPAHLLINGASIVQEDRVSQITYWHVELPEHAVLVADGAPAESYLDDGNRDNFDNAAVTALVKDFTREAGTHAERACAPVLRDGPALDAIRIQIAARVPADTTVARRA